MSREVPGQARPVSGVVTLSGEEGAAWPSAGEGSRLIGSQPFLIDSIAHQTTLIIVSSGNHSCVPNVALHASLSPFLFLVYILSYATGVAMFWQSEGGQVNIRSTAPLYAYRRGRLQTLTCRYTTAHTNNATSSNKTASFQSPLGWMSEWYIICNLSGPSEIFIQ